jgi:iron complex outermembrane recepter protein
MRLSVAVAVTCLALTSLSAAEPAAAAIKKQTNISPQSLGSALQTLAKDRDFQVLYRTEVVGQRQTAGAVGELSFDEAMSKLLSGSGLIFQYLDDKTVTILPVSEDAGSPPRIPSSTNDKVRDTQRTTFWDRLRIAQAGSPTESTSQGGSIENNSELKRMMLEEVVVTAQKRQERALDIPVSISVITNQDIERRGLSGMEDYLRSTPGVNQIDNGAQSNAIVIRGITTSPQFENFSSGTTVATYFDETPITAAGGLGAGGIDVRPVDIERIEVLRGPQGTTYGSASLGGAVRVIPVKPELDAIGAKFTASYSNTDQAGSDNSTIQGVLNLPLVQSKFGLRAVGYRYDDSGFYENGVGSDPAALTVADRYEFGDDVLGFSQDDVGRMLSTGGRLSALWQATDQLDVSLNFLTQDIEQDGAPVATSGTYVQSRWPVFEPARIRSEEPGETADTRIDLMNAVVNYDLSWATLTATVSNVDSGSGYVTAVVPTQPLSGTIESDFESVTAETRLISHLGGPLQFIAGLFYEDIDESYEQVSRWMGSTATIPYTPVTDPIGITEQTRQIEQRAFFGEVSYALTPKLTATVGGRFFEYERDETQLAEGGIRRIPLGTGLRTVGHNEESDDSLKANLSFKPTKESLIYASWAEGFRLGRPSAGLPQGACDLNGDGVIDGSNVTIESTRTIDSDFLESYEVGSKVTLFDRRMSLDASAYHIKWDGLPTRTIVPACGFAYTANVGEATSDGVELQARISVVDGLTVDVGGSYNEAELSKAAPALNAPKGAPLPGSPKMSANLAAQYDFQAAGYDAFVRADSLYVGEFYGDLPESPGTLSGDYIKVDARAGISIRNFSVELFVKNLTNEDAYTWRGLTAGTAFFGYRLRPRTTGIQLGYSF